MKIQAFDTAKITSKGQITIPKSVRKVLGVVSGDKVAFIRNDDNTFSLVNSSILALERVQEETNGLAQDLGLKNEEDVVKLIKEVRASMAKEKHQ